MNITKKNAQAAWDKGCSDVKGVLEALFPDMDFQPALKYKDGQAFTIELGVKISAIDADDPEGTYNIMSTDNDFDFDEWMSQAQLNDLIKK